MGQNLPPLPCACANIRRTMRAVTQLYDEELRPCGLRPTQFTLLQALQVADGVSQGDLASILCLDSTTLTRTLRLLMDAGFVSSKAGVDKRERLLSLTKLGRKKVDEVLPHWKKAQQRLKGAFGPGFPAFEDSLHRLATALS